MILFNTFHGKKRGQGNLYRSDFLSKKIEKEEKTILLSSDLKSINHQIKSCFSKIYDRKKISFKKIINKNDISLVVFDGPKITIKQSVFFSISPRASGCAISCPLECAHLISTKRG